MENLLKTNLNVLKDVLKMIAVETGCNIVICDHEGEIIEATEKERIGRKHMSSSIIFSGEADETIITEEQETEYRKLGTDTNAGYYSVISIQGKRVGSLGVAGEAKFFRPIVRIAAKTIGIYISEYLKEKDKNKILQKMATIAEEITLNRQGSLDYQVLAEDLLLIAGAKFVSLDLYDSSEGLIPTVALAGKDEDIVKFREIVDFQTFNTKQKIYELFTKKLDNKKIVCFDNYLSFTHDFVPIDIAKKIEKTFDLGKVYIVEISCKDNMIGNFCLLMTNGDQITNSLLVELYGAQVGQLLMRVQAEAALKESRSELKRTLNILESFWKHSPNPVGIFDKSGNIIRVSKSGSELLSSSPEEIIMEGFDEKCPSQIVQMMMERLRQNKENNESIGYTDGIKLQNGENRYYDSWVFPIEDSEQNTDLVGFVALDVTERKFTEEQLELISLHDSLTGLYNRTYFEKKMMLCSNEFPITIISLDVDGLKIINDTMGHDSGDQMLKALAGILRHSLRDIDLVFRVGGDEFVIILPGTVQKSAKMVVKRITSNIQFYNRKNKHLPINVSIGMATTGKNGDNLNEVLKKADEHMYHNKLIQKSSSRSQIINSLMKALAEKDFITQGHARRLLELCVKIGVKKNLTSGNLTSLALLSQIHDLGKVGIPDTILSKAGPLNEDEWKVIRQHPEKGYRIAIASADLAEVADLILKHHERWDGKGYPLGLKGEDIPIECRILRVVDSYDVMVNDRPYKETRCHEDAVEEIKRCAGSQFDPEIVELFLEVLEEASIE